MAGPHHMPCDPATTCAGYFDAPCAYLCPLSYESLIPLPSVTLLFCVIQGVDEMKVGPSCRPLGCCDLRHTRLYMLLPGCQLLFLTLLSAYVKRLLADILLTRSCAACGQRCRGGGPVRVP